MAKKSSPFCFFHCQKGTFFTFCFLFEFIILIFVKIFLYVKRDYTETKTNF